MASPISVSIDDGRKAAIIDFFSGEYNPVDLRKSAIQQMAFWDAYVKEMHSIVNEQAEVCSIQKG